MPWPGHPATTATHPKWARCLGCRLVLGHLAASASVARAPRGDGEQVGLNTKLYPFPHCTQKGRALVNLKNQAFGGGGTDELRVAEHFRP